MKPAACAAVYVFCVITLLLDLGACAHMTNEPVAPIWIDVRSEPEFRSGHIDDAWNIPHNEIGQRITEVVKHKDTAIHLYCGSGSRSEMAREILTGMGYTNVTNVGPYRDLISR
jgi:phage shock protein E